MTNIYKQRENWKIGLSIAGLLILLITLLYSNFLANRLAESENKNSQLYLTAMEFIQNNQDLDADLSVQDSILKYFTLPVIIKGEDGRLEGQNFNEEQNIDSVFLDQKVKEFKEEGGVPLKGVGYASEFYYFHSDLKKYISYFPLVQILLVGAFIGLGYFLFNTTKKAEQNRVWAGMAKETAHQLGTPISAMMAWILHLKEETNLNEEQSEVVEELEKDLEKLNLVADRFSKIGSLPELTEKDLCEELNRIKDYMARRAPKRVEFDFPNNIGQYKSKINTHLLDWVLENLMRNSLDAMNGFGTISARLYTEEGYNCIDLSDTGKGIPANAFKNVFQPGYSTKQRGWGLGLSLAKRIIEDYHKGKIFVKSSKINEGTTFTIKLPQM